jgi:hypothetical protein
MITSSDIRQRLNHRPFIPFRIETSSGQNYDIFHPEFVVVGKRVLGVGLLEQAGDPEFDQLHVLSVLHITALETLPTAAPAQP